MEIFSAGLPNVMFLVGIAAISIGLGIELKIVPVGNQVTRSGRIGAITVGVLLVVASIFIYLQPPTQVAAPSGTVTPATAAAPTAAVVAAAVGAAPAAPPAAPAAPAAIVASSTAEPPTAVPATATTELPTATAVPATATSEPPTATAIPATATSEPPTAVPPTVEPPTTVVVAGIKVPDIREIDTKEAEKTLREAGLVLGEQAQDCDKINVAEDQVRDVKKGKISCQSPAPDASVAPGTPIDYVVAGGRDDD